MISPVQPADTYNLFKLQLKLILMKDVSKMSAPPITLSVLFFTIFTQVHPSVDGKAL